MNHPPYLAQAADAVLLTLKVQPRARRTGFAGILGSALKLQVAAPPVDFAANEAVLEFIAESLGIHRRFVRLIRGATSRQKVVLIEGLSLEEVATKLNELNG
ncbi:MAG TPA: DUF167 domain-containing protein [Verrucomicrobiota bacterium]|nr:hypothetical protein [Verrucomicrobiales bacterium]HRI11442.1 DUF167 domain-containing protein [Verrucomicrobiota bacterium]